MAKEISVLTMSGGVLSEFGGKKAVKEYRTWVHFHDGREDKYFTGRNLRLMLKARKQLLTNKRFTTVEQTLAVVWDEKHKDYREVKIDS